MDTLELEAGPDLVVLTSTGELIGLTTCRDPVYQDGKSSLGSKDGFFISSSSFSRILLSASNNLSGEFMTFRSFCPIYFSECKLVNLLLQTLGLAFQGLIHAWLTTTTYRPPKHQSNFDAVFALVNWVEHELFVAFDWEISCSSSPRPSVIFTCQLISHKWLNFFLKNSGQKHCVWCLRQQ